MYKLCKTEQSANRQREIEKCLVEILKNKHYDDVTVTEICEKMNIPRKSFYRYFDGKEGIIHSMINHLMMDYNIIRSHTNSKDDITLKGEFAVFFKFWKDKEEILSVLDRSGILGRIIENATGFAMNEYNEVQGYLMGGEKDDKLVAYQFVVSGLMTMMINWYRGGFKESVENMARASVKIITRPLFENLTRRE